MRHDTSGCKKEDVIESVRFDGSRVDFFVEKAEGSCDGRRVFFEHPRGTLSSPEDCAPTCSLVFDEAFLGEERRSDVQNEGGEEKEETCVVFSAVNPALCTVLFLG